MRSTIHLMVLKSLSETEEAMRSTWRRGTPLVEPGVRLRALSALDPDAFAMPPAAPVGPYRAPRGPRLPIRETRVSLRNVAVIAGRLAAARAAYLEALSPVQRATFLAALTVTERRRALRHFYRASRQQR